MPVQIGAKSHSFADPTGLLSDCHRRVEMFLGTLAAVAKVADRPLTEETRHALEGALRYFSQAAPKHTADEEESLFPRLRRIDDPEIRSAFERLDKLEEDHRWAEPLHAEVERIGSQLVATGKLSDYEIASFRNAVARLTVMYREHIYTEEEIVFPVAARVLSETEKLAVAREMAERRDVPFVADVLSRNR